MPISRTSRIAIAVATITVCASATAWADADPPGRVGRLSDAEGTVSFHTSDQTDWSPATVNYPVTTGTSFWTEPDSKAEIQVGDSEIRLDQNTWADVVQLDDNATQFRINQGVVNIHVLTLPPGGVSVLTPKGQVDLLAPGSYDVNAGEPSADNTPADQTQLSVLEGSARFDGPRSAVDVQEGESATVSGDPINVSLAEAAPSPFDDWALSREHRETPPPPQVAQSVPPGMTGYQDLNANGQWAQTPQYGAVWYPNSVPAGWAPYTTGHWAYVAPWGWTWIDDAPWGFAPYHYGRWAMIGGRWGWAPVVPGVAIVGPPVYAPALVAFVGGGGFGISLSIGGPTAAVGWVPLAPFEVFHPWYHASPGYFRHVNVINVNRTVINNIRVTDRVTMDHFANRNAAVVVSAQAFTHAAPVSRARVDVPHDQLAHLQVANGRNMGEFKPTPEARLAAARPNAIPEGQAGAHASVADHPVAYHPAPEAAHPEAAAHAPGPKLNGPMAHPAPPMHQNAAVNGAPRPQPNAAPNQPHPAAAAPGPRPPAPRSAAQQSPRPAASAPPRPQAMRPQPRPQMQVQHPQQQRRLQATPQGWKRAAPAAHPAPQKEEKKQ
ncbi:MAG TPA: FecR family protein [Magnetospirillaceae bacterium]|jgi:hypothetical protein